MTIPASHHLTALSPPISTTTWHHHLPGGRLPSSTPYSSPHKCPVLPFFRTKSPPRKSQFCPANGCAQLIRNYTRFLPHPPDCPDLSQNTPNRGQNRKWMCSFPRTSLPPYRIRKSDSFCKWMCSFLHTSLPPYRKKTKNQPCKRMCWGTCILSQDLRCNRVPVRTPRGRKGIRTDFRGSVGRLGRTGLG